jgi:rhamnose transport system substrate-binding protein
MKNTSLALITVIALATLAGCGSTKDKPLTEPPSTAQGEKVKTVFIPKSAGNPYFNQLEIGLTRSADKFGLDYSSQAPQSADATSQIAVVKNQVQRGEQVIIISPNSPDALNEALDQATQKGVTIITADADLVGFEDHRAVGVLPVDFDTIGPAQIELLGSMIDYKGEFAILSATTDAPNQNAWIASMKKALDDPKYAAMKLVEIAYGDDEPQKSATETEALLVKHPNLRGIISPTTVGLASAAQVISQRGVYPGGKSAKGEGIILTGLGTPNELRKFVSSGVVQKFQLWDPADIGDVAAFLANAIKTNGMKIEEGAKFTVPGKGELTVGPKNVVIAGTLVTFEKSNIENYKF